MAHDPAIIQFTAMGCPCEILLDTHDPQIIDELRLIARTEALRIESKYSRYVAGNVVDRINRRGGQPIDVDEETAALLDYAARSHEMSAGLFDITTGALRRGAGPSGVGWDKVTWKRPTLTLPTGFEIDFGGICKEYAADRVLRLLRQRHPISLLVNFGGDIAADGDRVWSVGIESIEGSGKVARTVRLSRGAIATSGTTHRGTHILNPKTGRPVEQAPASVTVTGRTCTEAGFWSTLGVLHGARAEQFLSANALEFWCYRSS